MMLGNFDVTTRHARNLNNHGAEEKSDDPSKSEEAEVFRLVEKLACGSMYQREARDALQKSV